MQINQDFFHIKKIQIPSNVQITVVWLRPITENKVKPIFRHELHELISPGFSFDVVSAKPKTFITDNGSEIDLPVGYDLQLDFSVSAIHHGQSSNSNTHSIYKAGFAAGKNGAAILVKIQGPLGELVLDLKKMDSAGLAYLFINKGGEANQTQILEIYVKKEIRRRPSPFTFFGFSTGIIGKDETAQSSPKYPLPNMTLATGSSRNRQTKAFFGSLVSSIQNSIYGISQGFLIYLELHGIGFRAILHERIHSVGPTVGKQSLCFPGFHSQTGPTVAQVPDTHLHEGPANLEKTVPFQEIEFKIGQTHDIFYKIPKNIRAFSLKPSLICLYGIEKNQITQLASEIKNLKLPEPYKGKGIRFKDQIIKIKIGKKK
jgi:ribosomal protein L6P/L9E